MTFTLLLFDSGNFLPFNKGNELKLTTIKRQTTRKQFSAITSFPEKLDEFGLILILTHFDKPETIKKKTRSTGNFLLQRK